MKSEELEERLIFVACAVPTGMCWENCDFINDISVDSVGSVAITKADEKRSKWPRNHTESDKQEVTRKKGASINPRQNPIVERVC